MDDRDLEALIKIMRQTIDINTETLVVLLNQGILTDRERKFVDICGDYAGMFWIVSDKLNDLIAKQNKPKRFWQFWK